MDLGVLGRPAGWLALFGAVSLAAVALGVCVAAVNGAPSGVGLRNLAAWGAGAALAGLLATFAGQRAFAAAVWALPLGLGASLFFPDVEGVHRWIDLGPVHLNAAMLLMPMAAVALGAGAATRARDWAPTLGALVVLVAQPDASQATALAAVAALAAAFTVRTPLPRAGLILACGLLAAGAWLRPDPLKPVSEVEEIVGIAFGQSPLLGALALLLLAAMAAAPLLTTFWNRGAWLAGASLGLCLLLWAIMPFLGAFPVPLVGMGMSPIIGAWLGAGLLAAWMRRAALPASTRAFDAARHDNGE